jgi:Ser/Thr protein kinase RdoA (MazF antagonist)
MEKSELVLDDVAAIAARFDSGGSVTGVQENRTGNINKTFLVSIDAAPHRFILQRINKNVFKRPELVMKNIGVFTRHVEARLSQAPLAEGRRWETPRVLPARAGGDFFNDEQGECWRALSFIEGARSYDTAQSESHAREAGWALGAFHSLISDLPAESLADTLPGFHIAPDYLAHYDRVLAGHAATESPEVKYCMGFIEQRRALASVLEDARAAGRLPLRPIHGDPKINNVMMDTATGQAVSIIDLDTVKPGLVHYDIGDALRSACNPLGEETDRWEEVRFDTELARAILTGYLEQASAFLTPADYDHLYDSIRLIAFELGLRFFTDHLAGDVYFTADYRGHNLARALVQLQLAASIETQEASIGALIADCR